MGAKVGTAQDGVRFGILGSLRVEVAGRELPIGSTKQRRLLGALLVDAGTVVSADRLAEILWGDDQPDDPAGAIQTHVSRLRSLFARWGGDRARDVLVTQPPGYVLTVDREHVDAGRFEELVEEARAAATAQATADLLGVALELWRGRPLAEFDDEFARVEAVRLQELRLAAVELRADALLTMGRFDLVVEEVEAAVARNPLRERLRGQLMVALDRCGRRADALATYRDLRDVLVTELGMEPSAPLRRLEQAILQQAEDLPWPTPTAASEVGITLVGTSGGASGQRAGPATTSLPEVRTSFVGREEALRGVTTMLGDRGIVVLTGTGGVGKSRLAVRAARRLADQYEDGVVLCDLLGADDPGAVDDLVATTLGVPPAEGSTTREALIALLRSFRLLLVLDNCEHVLPGAAALVDEVARACPGVDVLATSRQPLGVPGEQVWPVHPLEVGDGADGPAVRLFLDRAEAVDPDLELSEADREAVVELCRRLDGLPLAVELAAARVRAMTPDDIVARLDRRFRLLTTDAGTAPPRHRSLEAVIDWSRALLPEETRRLFDRLSVFAGGFDLDAAEQVCAGDGVEAGEVAGRLAQLVDHSLVAVDRSGPRMRYRLLETLRAHGAARLEERGDLATWHRRHGEYFIALAERAAAGVVGPEEARWGRILETEFANLRAVHARASAAGEVDRALRLPGLLRVYAYYRLRDEVYGWALRALDLPGASRSPAAPAARVTAAVGCMQRGQLDRAREIGEQVLAEATDGDVALRARQLLTEIALYRGRLDETDRRGADLVVRARAAHSVYYEALGDMYRVFAAAYAGRSDDALARLEEGWQAVERTGNPTLRSAFWYLEGEVRLDDDPDTARAALREAVEIAHSVDNRFLEGVARVAMASLQARHGEPDEALAEFRDVVDHWRSRGDWVHMWTTLHNLVVLLDRIGAHEPAAVLHGAARTATTGAPAFGEDARRLDAVAHSLRTVLGEEVFAAAHTRGRDMDDGEAVAYALEAIDGLLASPVAPSG